MQKSIGTLLCLFPIPGMVILYFGVQAWLTAKANENPVPDQNAMYEGALLLVIALCLSLLSMAFGTYFIATSPKTGVRKDESHSFDY